MKRESAIHATTYLRQADRDRYLATLLLPADRRAAVAALYAFNAEIASVPDRAREPAAGEIRLRWWADAIEGAGHGEVRANPVADALLSVTEDYRLPVAALGHLIEARRFDLYQDPMPDQAAFEGYAGETASALYQLAAMILNGGRPVDAADAAGHLGVAHALIGHLRAFGYNASHGRIFLPWAVFAICGVKEVDVLAGHPTAAIAVALTRLADVAAGHLREADAAIAKLPRELRAVFASTSVLKDQLRRLDFESPFHAPRDVDDWQKIARLAWWKLRRA